MFRWGHTPLAEAEREGHNQVLIFLKFFFHDFFLLFFMIFFDDMMSNYLQLNEQVAEFLRSAMDPTIKGVEK